ncbi:DUF411 domain-containing protein [Ancylobacter polymorphus]|uniref:DUF411 domain-containing protein n=1 Tax=Ancylobacter polymorphus TaxID=223390 RepID=A0A9E7A0N9_9HYPH|nr:DUF411 domain-containing protein [Ancylobacter polymorphus]UOK73797.1 DUF411 domain-containing protein [Ancylobacter polymorphus]
MIEQHHTFASRETIVTFSRRKFIGLAGGLGASVIGITSVSAAGTPISVTRSPSCGCCSAWIAHLRQAGFSVEDKLLDDLAPLKTRLGVPVDLQSCHTATLSGYVIEGHVPATEIFRILAERPAATGLAVAGMPTGSPGMEIAGQAERYDVVLFGPRGRQVFARY